MAKAFPARYDGTCKWCQQCLDELIKEHEEVSAELLRLEALQRRRQRLTLAIHHLADLIERAVPESCQLPKLPTRAPSGKIPNVATRKV